jgi:hypothetical protein
MIEWSWNTPTTNNATHVLSSVHAIVELELLCGNTCYVTPDDVIQTLMCFSHELYGHHQRRCHNCSCGTKAVEKFMWYRTNIWTVQNQGPGITPRRTAIFLRTAYLFPDQSSFMDAVLLLAETSTTYRWAILRKAKWADETYFTS